MNISRLRFKAAVTGFSLIEMAVVIVVLTIILAVIAQPVASQVENRKIIDTQKKLEDVKEALYGYALANGRLPLPAMSATNGVEMTACATELACTGFIPWATLGIDKSDAWGGIIRYTVTPALAINPFMLTTPGTKDVVSRNGATPTPSHLADKVAAIVWSHGKRNFGTNAESAVPRANSGVGNTDEFHNNTLPIYAPAIVNLPGDPGTVVYSRIPSDNAAAPGGEFDDLVSWIPTSILMGKMVQAGQLP